MRTILALVFAVSLIALAGCRESPGEKVERTVRNAVDDVTK